MLAQGRGEPLHTRYGSLSCPAPSDTPGASGMQAFADPEYGIATTFIGRVPIADSIYDDLGLGRKKS